LTDAGGKEIARTISYNRSLVKLNLESNRLGNIALEIVKNIISHQSTMSLRFVARKHAIFSKIVMTFIIEYYFCFTFRYLNMNANNMSGNVFNQIRELFQNNTKIKLILDNL
jgi:hypothetical protein